MPTNHGNIGVNIEAVVYGQLQVYAGWQCFKIGPSRFLDEYLVRLTKDTSDGFPAQPCMKIVSGARKQFLWPVVSGTRSISVACKYTPDNGTGTRPILYIYANPDVGVSTDISTPASAGANSWNTIGPVNVTVSATGVLLCELRWDTLAQYPTQVVRWDNITVS